MVQNKSADVLIYPEVASYSSTDYLVQNDFKEVENKVNQGDRELGTVVKTLSEMRSLGGNNPIIFDGVDTSEVGITELAASIKFLDSEIVDPDSNNEQTAQANVTWTNPLKLGIFDIVGCVDENGNEQQPYTLVDSKFISSYLPNEPKKVIEETFPVADFGTFITSEGGVIGFCDNKSNKLNSSISNGMLYDLNSISRLKQASSSYNRAIAIASSSYFDYHQIEGQIRRSGIALPPGEIAFPGAIVEESKNPEILAHELVHTFVGSSLGRGDSSGTSYDNSGHTNRPVVSAYSAMSNRVYLEDEVVNYMLPDETPITLNQRIDNTSYGLLFDALMIPMVDPEVIIISGFLKDDGSVVMDKTLISKTGVVTPSPGEGDFKIALKNTQGEVLHSIQYNPRFELLLHPGGIQYMGVEPFVVSLPYVAEVNKVEVTYLGEVKTQFDPVSTSLVDAVKSLTFEQIKGRNSRLKKIRKALLVRQAEFIENLNNKYNEAKSKCESSSSSKRWRGGFLSFFKNDCVEKKSLEILLKLKLSLYKKVIEYKLNSNNGMEANKKMIINTLDKIKSYL